MTTPPPPPGGGGNQPYDPSASKGSVGGGGSVPATYELDWTAAQVPCLPSAKGG